MPVFPSQNLSDKKICESYTSLLQIYNGDLILKGDGTQVQSLKVTSSYAISASYAPCNCPIMHTGSTYPITASWAIYTATSSYIQVTNVSYPIRKIYNNYTVVKTTDYTILCDATSGSFNVKLPNPVGNTNIYNIKKIDRTGNCIHVTVTNASNIDYDVTQSICHRGTNLSVQSDSTNQYWIL
jgi:hypothetical protein